MQRILFLLLLFVLLGSHDMYLKLDPYFLPPHTPATIQLFNGTFAKSDNVIDRDRMVDVSLVGNGERIHPDTTQWSERDSTTFLTFETGEPGTWVAGVSTRPREIAMDAADFNDYLAHDGVLDMLAVRKKNNTLDADAVERYSKHVKAIFQVGDRRTDDWQTRLGYPLEFVPLANPYHLHADESLQVQLLWRGEPLADQLVYVDYVAATGHSHAHAGEAAHSHSHETTADAGHQHGTAPGHSHAAGADHDHDHSADHEHEHETGHAHEQEHDHDHDHAADHAHEHDHNVDHEHDSAASSAPDHAHTTGTRLRTDADGVVTVDPSEDGSWYLRTIYLVESDAPGLTHESNWATLTFAVADRHSHGPADHDHGHAHATEAGLGIPTYVYWIGSLVLLGGLFVWFNRQGAA